VIRRDAEPRSVAICARVWVLVALLLFFAPAGPADAAPWLFVSDVHLDPLDAASAPPSSRGSDTDEALLRSALAEMRRVDPAAPVVVIPGDFLGHERFTRNAIPTMAHIARSFDDAFPHAQFVLALGNEDSNCGDYGAGPGAPFSGQLAAVWEPLVNRRGAAPDFRTTFARDGFYTAKLPIPGLRAVVIDDIFASPRYRERCGSTAVDAATEALDDLDRALPPGSLQKNWVILHIPPGIDAFSTVHLMHHLAVVPFLESGPRDRLLAILGDPRRRVALAIAGHTHKFAFRLVDAGPREYVPMLLVPALSPVFHNNPMFLTVDVGRDGTVRRIDEHAYDGVAWHVAGSSADLGLPAFTGAALAKLEGRLDDDPALRSVYARLYDGGAPPEIAPWNWRSYRCAIRALTDTAYRNCTGQRGYGFLTLRGVIAGAAVTLVGLVATILAIRVTVRRMLTSRG
jgi:hypothetical protein